MDQGQLAISGVFCGSFSFCYLYWLQISLRDPFLRWHLRLSSSISQYLSEQGALCWIFLTLGHVVLWHKILGTELFILALQSQYFLMLGGAWAFSVACPPRITLSSCGKVGLFCVSWLSLSNWVLETSNTWVIFTSNSFSCSSWLSLLLGSLENDTKLLSGLVIHI